jgi:hypothetical protein
MILRAHYVVLPEFSITPRGSRARRGSTILESGMQVCTDDGALADRGAHPLDRSGPYVAGGKYAADAGFERSGRANPLFDLRPPEATSDPVTMKFLL